jgi:hypothetical protein
VANSISRHFPFSTRQGFAVGKLSQFFKRLAKPAAMAGVAASLSLSLVVTTPSNAQAFVSPVPLPVVFGATRMAIPALMPVAAALGPVGWGLAGVAAVAAIGVALYETRDTWVPWVEGQFGKEGTNPDAPAPPADTDPATEGVQVNYYPGLKIQNHRVVANGYHFDTYYSGSDYATGTQMGVTATLNCKRPDGTTYLEKKIWAKTFGTGWTTTYPRLRNFNDGYCQQSSHVLLGAIVGHFGADPELHPKSASAYKGPENIVRHGSMLQGSFDAKSPETKYETSVECIAQDGTKSTIKKEWTGDSPGMLIPSCEAQGKGHGTGKMWVDGSRPGVTQAPTRLWDNPAPQPTPGRELCAPTRAQQGCKLAVKVDGKDCVMGLFECENWQEIHQNDPGKDGTTPRVSCQYGPYSLPVDQCNPLERAYEKDGAPVSEPNIDGNPATRSDTNLNNAPNEVPQAAKPLAVPGGAGTTLPNGSTTEQAQCFPSGWSMLNPVEWVMKPVSCALDAAFKPKKDIQTRVTSMQGKFSNKVPISWFSTGTGGVSGGACPADWAVTVNGERYSLICGTPVDAAVQAFRPIMGAMLIIALLWPLIRSLFYAAIPVFKVTPS